ncbi:MULTISPECIES: hypothetical protein [unclassified Sphingomonas]|uniref:hypothetical protein n=1 Tax=unclassified Sphingomonas TaxID=196159 RepID=UPI0006F2F4F5|nr:MULTISPECIES: hypothetical protein [unclassified Sphingomonas]KQM61720.1 hypothetical protein ASE65_05745 [Sphingomonas sp. Leaf16]KQN12993.1 hypothetical protein ASE81_06760 [Sphingomonas sp. Leaf29]KQN19879.1 hypothetical protein ASE83_06685 [Sphingomonas sp. Leaf32]
MIDLMASGAAAALSPPVPAERRDEGGPAFAIVLAQALTGPEMVPVPIPEPPIDAMPVAPAAVALVDPAKRPVVADHAIRFDARGMIAMAAGGANALVEAPVVTSPVPVATNATVLSMAMPRDAVMPSSIGGGHAIAATAVVAVPADRAVPVRPSPSPAPLHGTAVGEAPPAPAPPEEPELAVAPAARPCARLAAMAQGAPQVAVIALAEGLAVSAAVGALSEGERHRMRDAIAATLSRHGLRPRAVTLLAMPAPTLRTER